MIDYCGLARSSLETWLLSGRKPKASVHAGLRAGCFVSLHDGGGELRGCIGTIEPRQGDLVDEVLENAVAAGTRDPRFAPVVLDEMDDLVFEVSVLQPPQPVASPDALDPARYGVVVANGTRRGVLLPGIESIDTVARQLAIVKRKAAIGEDETVDLWRFEVEKHHE